MTADLQVASHCGGCRQIDVEHVGAYCGECLSKMAETGQLVLIVPLDGTPRRLVRWIHPLEVLLDDGLSNSI